MRNAMIAVQLDGFLFYFRRECNRLGGWLMLSWMCNCEQLDAIIDMQLSSY